MMTASWSVAVDVPASTAYTQWTLVELYPHFMSGVIRVERLEGTLTRWDTEVAGMSRQFEAEFVEAAAEGRVSWHSAAPPRQNCTVAVRAIDDHSCAVTFTAEYEPGAFVDRMGSTLGTVEDKIRGDVERFHRFVEPHRYRTPDSAIATHVSNPLKDSGAHIPPDWI